MKWIIKKDRRTEKLNRHWQYCIGSGHASLALRADYLEQIKKVHDELGIERVRFHGIFHEDMQVHMSMADLMLVPGAEEVESWPFEVWNEPDVFVFWAGSKEDYYKLYETTAKAIKEIDPRIQVGDPATSGSKWVCSFMNYCEEHDIPVDFISVHQYAGDPIGGVEASDNMEEERDLSDISSVMSGQEEMLQLFADAQGGSSLDGIRTLMPDKSELTDIPGDGFKKMRQL